VLQPDVRQPGLQVLVNGAPLRGVYDAEIHTNAYLAADRFSFRSALAADDAALWSAIPLQVEIRAGLEGAWQSLIVGQGDTLQIDPIAGDVELSGRDGTALFIAAQTHESFENLTSSDVASLLAGRHGLTATVNPTTELIGRFYQAGHSRTALSQHGRATTEWDVLSWLAQQEGYEVWVSGTTLYFQPPAMPSGYVTISPDDCLAMELGRDLAIGAGFSLQVQSWDCALQQVVSESAMYGNGATSGASMIALRPNLGPADAQLLAQRITAQLSSHERTVSFEAPADLVTVPRMQMQLYGTNTDFDGAYTIYDVERRFSAKRGFTQFVRARRSSWTIS
jgi:hypothetical protein